MTATTAQLGLSAEFLSLASHLRDAGVVLLACNETGTILPAPEPADDWLEDLFRKPPLFARALSEAMAKWSQQEVPAPVQALPGVWLVPLMVRARRRRSMGMHVAVLPTEELLASEHFNALCGGSGLDVQLCARLFANLPPISTSSLPRVISLVRYAHACHMSLQSGAQAMNTVGQQLAESYEEINLLYTIIRSMTVEQRPERFVRLACEELLETLPYGWIAAQMAENPRRLKGVSGRFIVAGQPTAPQHALREEAMRLFKDVEPDSPMVIAPRVDPGRSGRSMFGDGALVHPVTSDGAVTGLLIAGEKQGEDVTASSVDMKLLGATSSHMAIFLENAALYDDLNAMFLGTLEALTASIDAKDRYTCGHSQRVAHLTEQIALAAGMDEKTAHRMWIAGLVHDVGKIGVREAVLTKPGRLTEEEFAEIREHPRIGYRILKDIPQLNDILPGVLHHHERWDGGGYPDGLAGEDIPLVARLITLADSFDAMSSTRTYRARLSRDEVLTEMRDCAGSHFDPNLVGLFIDLDFREFDEMITDHHAADAPPTGSGAGPGSPHRMNRTGASEEAA